MKSIVRHRYGSSDVLEFGEADRPEATQDRALIRVHASSVNAHDWHMMRGKPYLARMGGQGLVRPTSTTLGLDVAGVVEAVGPDVTDLAPGDEVFGTRSGAFAEYVSTKNVVRMPAGLSFEEAASLPVAGFTALQAVRDKAEVRPGQRVLVNGAGGGVGSLVIQIAKAHGAEVTGVTSTANLELVAALGADRVVDYTRDDFTRGRDRYDAIFDAGGNWSLARLRHVLAADGTLVMIAPGAGQWVGPLVRIVGAMLISRISTQRLRPFLSSVSREDLVVLRELVEAGKLRPVIDRTFAYEEIPAAIRYVESGASHGKVVIRI
jgi:NADPH:quinone reductase-like Zn-dependent oxidoreductase